MYVLYKLPFWKLISTFSWTPIWMLNHMALLHSRGTLEHHLQLNTYVAWNMVGTARRTGVIVCKELSGLSQSRPKDQF